MVKRILAVVLVILLIGSLNITAFATHPVPDLSKNGSITFIMDWEGEMLDGGNLNMYKVGLINEDNGDYSFQLLEQLENAGAVLEDLADPILAEELLTLAKALRMTKLTAPIEEGSAVFEDLPHGLYLVFQDKEDAVGGFHPIAPFLISVPRFQNDEYVLDVVAKPKVPLETVPPTTKPPPDPNLPQTGQLNWPVPVLAVAGAGLLMLGFVLISSGKKDRKHA